MTPPAQQPDCGLWYARALIADAPMHDPVAVLAACGWIIQHSDNVEEIDKAQALRELMERQTDEHNR